MDGWMDILVVDVFFPLLAWMNERAALPKDRENVLPPPPPKGHAQAAGWGERLRLLLRTWGGVR